MTFSHMGIPRGLLRVLEQPIGQNCFLLLEKQSHQNFIHANVSTLSILCNSPQFECVQCALSECTNLCLIASHAH